jgi:putative heme-binding domain-containing protein
LAQTEEGSSDSPLVKLLKRLPDDRKSSILERIGKQGKPAELKYIFDQSVTKPGFSKVVRLKAINSLIEAALTRKTNPEGNLSALGELLKDEVDPATRLAAIRLVALWKVESLSKSLRLVAANTALSEPLRASALDSLASLGGDENQAAIAALTASKQSPALRALAVSSLARLNAKAAVQPAVLALKDAAKGQDFAPMLAPFLDRNESTALLTEAIAKGDIPADSARLALRALYSLGRSDTNLVDVLNKAGKISAVVKAPDKTEVDALIADVNKSGDAARGELIFRRADLNCMKCHAVAGAAGGVGPELSPVGASSPVDYLINSIMVPDQAIKEEYVTKVIQTTDGRVFHGIVIDKDDKRMILREATGELRTIPADDIDDTKEGGSLMPKGLVNFLTRAEFVDLLRYLSELGKPGPYAIHTTPTIQRFRVLKSSSDELTKNVPDETLFEREVAGADSNRWLPAYALTPGTVPLKEFAALAENSVVYLQAEVNVTAAGPVNFNVGSADHVNAWLDGKSQTVVDKSFTVELEPGVHKLVLRIDTEKRTDLKVVVTKPASSSAEFTVVGGR